MYKRILAIAAAVILTAAVLAGCSAISLGRSNVTNTYDISEHFDRVSIHTDTADIKLRPSGGGDCKVVVTEHRDVKHSVSVESGALTVDVADSRTWLQRVSLFSSKQEITVYLPDRVYSSLVIEDSTGDISAEKLSFGMVSISVTTGDIAASGLNCESFSASGSTGNVSLNGVIAEGVLTVDTSTGNVTLDMCDAAELFISTSTGNVSGTLLTDKIFDANTGTGRVRLPGTDSGGICRITTSTGNITMDVKI